MMPNSTIISQECMSTFLFGPTVCGRNSPSVLLLIVGHHHYIIHHDLSMLCWCSREGKSTVYKKCSVLPCSPLTLICCWNSILPMIQLSTHDHSSASTSLVWQKDPGCMVQCWCCCCCWWWWGHKKWENTSTTRSDNQLKPQFGNYVLRPI